MAYILIVDTQTELRHQLVRLLEQAGHRATAVATGSEGAATLGDDVSELLATNIVLIDGSGTRSRPAGGGGRAKVLMIRKAPTRSSSC